VWLKWADPQQNARVGGQADRVAKARAIEMGDSKWDAAPHNMDMREAGLAVPLGRVRVERDHGIVALEQPPVETPGEGLPAGRQGGRTKAYACAAVNGTRGPQGRETEGVDYVRAEVTNQLPQAKQRLEVESTGPAEDIQVNAGRS
jgi:hypothetical protein